MNVRRDSVDLHGRRKDMGITTAADGLGAFDQPQAPIAVEKGMAADDRQKFYADWLTRLETLPKPRRAIMPARWAAGGHY
jgi:hypothetical protein